MSDPYNNYPQQSGLQGSYPGSVGLQGSHPGPIGSGVQGPFVQQIGPGLQDPYTNYTQQMALGKRPHGQPDMTPSNRQQCLEPITTRPGETLPYAGVPSMSGVQPGMVVAEPIRQSTLPPVVTQPGLIAGDAGVPADVGAGPGLVGAGAEPQPVFDRNKEIGIVIFRPIEGKFYKDKDIIGKMDPYCKFKIGWHRGKSSVAKGQGTTPTWGDEVTLQRKHGEQFAKLKAKDKDTVFNDRLGQCKINLDEVALKGKVHQWYTLTKGSKVTGEVLLDIEFTPRVV